ncbi:NAD kinase [Prevotella ihumii]|uniref:NAD kinase n=1 Tax=Prevotella ihumii TaxID=1917878 RepID=UPI00098200C7|nr:NAD kinase [Prevotella ihumii]
MAEKKLSFAIFGNPYRALAAQSMCEVLEYLSQRNADVYVEETFYNALDKRNIPNTAVKAIFKGDRFKADCAISMGGDGTLLKAASKVGAKNIPIIGVNLGRLGFLAEVLPEELHQTLDDIYTANYGIDERAVLIMETKTQLLHIRPYALNDIAILKRDHASMITIHASVNGEYLVSYLADGLIISTPTGSTAYSLSNGGPILVPQSRSICLTPVAPHSLNIRPIVLTDDVEIRLEVESRSHNFLVAVDGRSEKLSEGSSITIRKAPYKIRIVKPKTHRYFSTLRTKLMWGADIREHE